MGPTAGEADRVGCIALVCNALKSLSILARLDEHIQS